jgi:DNA modification methylase/endonuclease YncB( thermonuclease family)
MTKTSHKIIIGDARQMNSLKNESVHLVITSPPYWQLKDYGKDEQLGYHDSYEDYINNLNLVWEETYRVLKPGCRLCINIGDQFARASYYGRYKVIPIRTEIIKFCESAGYDYMGAVIWQKITTTNTTGGASVMGSYPYPRNGILKLDYEFILLFKKPGELEKVSQERKEASRLSKEEWKAYFSGHWQIPGTKQTDHLATFPVQIPDRLIKMFSFVEDVILDPFLGSGTTSLSAMNLKRNSVGIEINENFLSVIKNKLNYKEQIFVHEFEIDIDQTKLNENELTKRISKFCYKFSDPHHLDRKQGSEKKRYGSRISDQDKDQAKYYMVKEILQGDLVRLSNDKTFRLLGVEIIKNKNKEAVHFLSQKTKSKQVMIKFDRSKKDKDNDWIGYLYLKNKTFLNAHLIKLGFAEADTKSDHKYLKRFLAYQYKSKEL